MNTVKTCPVCNLRNYSTVFHVEKFPYFTSPVKKEDKVKILKKYKTEQLRAELHPVVCQDCEHIYLHKRASVKVISDLYRNYYNYPSAMEGSFRPVRDQAFIKVFKNRIRKLLTKKQNRILEIGCFDGYVLYHLKEMGFSVTGCDPSHGAAIGKRFGLDIKKRFFKVEDFLKKGLKYDVIIFRHFLEHLSEPVGFLRSLKGMLRLNGMVVFEVPNVEYCLKNGNTSIFSFQHLQYFSKASIYSLIKNAGLKTLKYVDAGENLIVTVAKGKSQINVAGKKILTLSRSFKSNLSKNRDTLRDMIKDISGKKIFLWGAGGFGANFLEMYGISGTRVKYIVDSDKKKWGMEYLMYHIPIVSPEKVIQQKHDCMIVCSMYAKEIVNRLQDFCYKNPVISIAPDIKLLNRGFNAKR